MSRTLPFALFRERKIKIRAVSSRMKYVCFVACIRSEGADGEHLGWGLVNRIILNMFANNRFFCHPDQLLKMHFLYQLEIKVIIYRKEMILSLRTKLYYFGRDIRCTVCDRHDSSSPIIPMKNQSSFHCYHWIKSRSDIWAICITLPNLLHWKTSTTKAAKKNHLWDRDKLFVLAGFMHQHNTEVSHLRKEPQRRKWVLEIQLSGIFLFSDQCGRDQLTCVVPSPGCWSWFYRKVGRASQ